MFRAKPRFNDDKVKREWVQDELIDLQFESLPLDCDIYILNHWFYCMATAPMFKSFDSKSELGEYLKEYSAAGDFIEVWCINTETLGDPHISAKIPNEKGEIPVKGAY